jgi:molybdenum cofactor synthesis domain
MGKILAICISKQRGVQKKPINEAKVIADWGIEHDAHGGDWHRQVSLLSADKIEDFRKNGVRVGYGAFGENLVVSGLDFAKLSVGTLLRAGEVLLEMTQIGKECHAHCAVYHQVGDCIMPREGVFAKVLTGGVLHPGDELVIEERKGNRPYRAAVITLSDKGSRGERIDESGPVIVGELEKRGFEITETLLLPDDEEQLKKQLVRLSDQRRLDIIITTGGTGFAPTDITPEATLAVADRLVPGIAEAIRAESMRQTKRAIYSRAVSVLRKKTLIVNLPGSPKACRECLAVFMDTVAHPLDLLRYGASDCAEK